MGGGINGKSGYKECKNCIHLIEKVNCMVPQWRSNKTTITNAIDRLSIMIKYIFETYKQSKARLEGS